MHRTASKWTEVVGSHNVLANTSRFDPHDDHTLLHKTATLLRLATKETFPEVNRQAQLATALASQDIAPQTPPRTNGEEVDPFEATVNRGRPRVRRNLPEGPIYHNFGDRNIYDRHVDERNSGD